jgi:hypothetical protein
VRGSSAPVLAHFSGTPKLGSPNCLPRFRLRVFPKLPELFVPAFEEIFDFAPLEIAKGLGNVLPQIVGGGVRVAVSAAEGFGDDRIDHA